MAVRTITNYIVQQNVVFIWIQLLLISHRVYSRKNDLIVNTEKGKVRGVRFVMRNLATPVDAYLGIPFAKPPVDHLRFKHPEPIEKWDYIYNATTLPNSCYQNPDRQWGDFYGATMWNAETRVSEDCLYLNVWVPKKHPRLKKSAVLVWIYGGGFYSGTTTLSLYDGKVLAAENDIIVVSIAYRLGALGFLALNHPSAPGNAGLFDQLLGLEWVRQNIKYFGGDPENVTLMGESAGSVSVSLHLLSPKSKDKFARAIMQSGTGNMKWATLTMDQAKERSVEFATEYLMCPKTHDMGELSACLRSKGPQVIVDEQWVSLGIAQFPFVPVIDGSFLIESPEMSLKRGSFKKCPVLMGSNFNEGSFFVMYESEEHFTLDKTVVNRKDYLELMEQLFLYYPQYPQENTDIGVNAIAYQYSNWLDPDDHELNAVALDQAVGDCHFLCPVNAFAHEYARVGQHVFMYYFTERYISHPWPKWTGVMHGDEIVFTFGEPLKEERRTNFTSAEKEFSRQVMKYWTNFAKTGDPNRSPGHSSESVWPLHTPYGKEYLELNSKYNNDKRHSTGRGPRAKECAFWLDYLPQLITETEREKEECNHNPEYTHAPQPTKDPHERSPTPCQTFNITCGAVHSGTATITNALTLQIAVVFYWIFMKDAW